MMKKYIILAAFAIAGLSIGCDSDKDYLDLEPTNVLSEETVFNSPDLVVANLADFYNRYYDFGHVDDWRSLSQFNVAFWSTDYGAFENDSWGYGDWGTWDYGYIRQLNLFLERLEASSDLDEELKARFMAEGRFLRASYYFELATRVGGAPLILESLTYDFSGDATYLQYPRSTEAELYDFAIAEVDAIKDDLPSNPDIKGRATKAAALAMQARAALYAGSIANYGQKTPQVSLPGGEVGIPASKAEGYYTKALSAAQQIINGDAGSYSLYMKNPDNLSENFADIFLDKNDNPEAIFVEDYKLQSGKTHGFTIDNQPIFNAEEQSGGSINPSLNLVEAFETLDGEYAPLPNKDASGNFIVYDQAEDIFDNRDARLKGTVIIPGSTWKGRPVDIFAGLQLADGSVVTSPDRGKIDEVPAGSGNFVQVVGSDGPIDGLRYTAQTGFYIRKHLDPKSSSGEIGTRSDVWNIHYRYAEVLLNAAEAAFELDQPEVAAGYMNQVRARAGITVPLDGDDITFDRIAHERYVEFAFEGLYFYDMKRWRIATEVFDGVPITTEEITQNIGDATKRATQPYGIWPYKLYEPGSPDDGKYIYKVVRPNRVRASDRFRLGNYYSEINQGILNNNPLIVKQPNQ